MESYIIFISPEASTFKEIVNGLQCRNNKLISDYKNQQTILTNDCSTSSVPCAVKIIDFGDYCNINTHDIVWKDLNQITFDVLNAKEDEIKENSKTTDELSEYLYKLADSLPSSGSYHVDIVWNWKENDSLKIHEHLKLFGSLRKLMSWHNGYLYIIENPLARHSDCNDWVEMLGGEIVTCSYLAETFDPRLTFWRGSVSVYNKENEISQSLFGFHLTSEISNLFNDSIFVNDEDGDINGKIILSSNMEVVSECDVNSVPIYIITPHTFRLTVKSNSSLLENSTSWLTKFNSQAKLGLIVRLHYSTSNTIDNDKRFNPTTESWKNAMKSGNHRISVPPLTKHTQQLNFLMIGNTTGLRSVKLHLLQTSYPLLGFLNERLGIQAKIMEISRNATDTWMPTLESLPYYDTECIADALAVVKEVQSNVLSYWKLRLDEGDDLPEMNSENIRHVFVKARQKVLEKLIDQSTKALRFVNVINEKTQPRAYVPEFLHEPNNWPERKSLMKIDCEDQMMSNCEDRMLSNCEDRMLSNCSLADLVSDSGKYFLMCFDKNGNPKQQRKLSKLESSVDEKQANDKSTLDECHTPDIHYNNDTANEKTGETVNFYPSVADETASISSSTATTGRPRRSRISSDTSDKSFLRRSPRVKKCSTPSRTRIKCSGERNLSATEVLPKLSSKSLKNEEQKITIKKVKKVACTNTETNHKRQSTIQKSLVKDIVNTMSDHHRIKLRNAVYNALEEHGIPPSHSLFRQCGNKLFTICKTFVKDVVAGQGSTSEQMRLIASSHVKQVIDFETQFELFRRKSTP